MIHIQRYIKRWVLESEYPSFLNRLICNVLAIALRLAELALDVFDSAGELLLADECHDVCDTQSA